MLPPEPFSQLHCGQRREASLFPQEVLTRWALFYCLLIWPNVSGGERGEKPNCYCQRHDVCALTSVLQLDNYLFYYVFPLRTLHYLLTACSTFCWGRLSPSNWDKGFSNVNVALLDIWIPRLPSSSRPAQRPRGRDSFHSQWPALPKHSRPSLWALLLLAPRH